MPCSMYSVPSEVQAAAASPLAARSHNRLCALPTTRCSRHSVA